MVPKDSYEVQDHFPDQENPFSGNHVFIRFGSSTRKRLDIGVGGIGTLGLERNLPYPIWHYLINGCSLPVGGRRKFPKTNTILIFALHGRWEALDCRKILLQGPGSFCRPGGPILRKHLFVDFNSNCKLAALPVNVQIPYQKQWGISRRCSWSLQKLFPSYFLISSNRTSIKK